MSTTKPTQPLKLPTFYLSYQQVQDSQLLSPERLAQLAAEIERRLSMPQDTNGTPITSARLVDLSPYGRFIHGEGPGHDDPWYYARQQILAAILTEPERELLKSAAHSAGERRREEERFAKAAHIPAADWKGWVTDGEHYWDSIESYLQERGDEMEDLIEDGTIADMVHMPRYLWAARPEPVIRSRDVADVFESQMCDRGPEDMDVDDLNGVTELQAAIEAFVKVNEPVIAYHMDSRTAIILSDLEVQP